MEASMLIEWGKLDWIDLIFGEFYSATGPVCVGDPVVEMSQRAHNLLNCVNAKASTPDFYDCCKNQRPVLLCTIPMLLLWRISSSKLIH